MKQFCPPVSVVLILASMLASCVAPPSGATGPQCAFADLDSTISLGICDLVAEYYVAHRHWPLTRAQLEELPRRLLEEEKSEMSAEEHQELSAFLDRFTLLDLRLSGEDLVLHYRFTMDRKTSEQSITFRPRSTADEILESASVRGHD